VGGIERLCQVIVSYFLFSYVQNREEFFLLLYHRPRQPAADKDEWTKNSLALAPATRAAGQSSFGCRAEVCVCRLQVPSQKCSSQGKRAIDPFNTSLQYMCFRKLTSWFFVCSYRFSKY
jgi:hypothetical protein